MLHKLSKRYLSKIKGLKQDTMIIMRKIKTVLDHR